jgi:hypothetical protein
MCANEYEHSPGGRCEGGITRRGFLGGLGGTAALGAVAVRATSQARAEAASSGASVGLPAGTPLRVKPALVYHIPKRAEKTSWRMYGGSRTQADIDKEARQIGDELTKLTADAGFPIEIRPLALVASEKETKAVADTDCDVILVYACSGDRGWLELLAASKKPNIMFVRHKSGQVYFWYETAHWWFLRKLTDEMKEPNMDADDIVVDDYEEVLWRLRALYGLKNARGTKCLAVGGLQAYSVPGQERGPVVAKDIWGYDISVVPDEAVAERIRKARADEAFMWEMQRRTDELLAQPGVALRTEKKFVFNSLVAMAVFKEMMREKGATNLGVAHCMGSLISLLDTPPCLVLSMLNDEGLTAFCHTDYTHTPPGVLLRWISGKPSFVCNSHFPHAGQITLAHCAAPRRMNGKDCEPTAILTHFESDYGAATKVEYRKGQVTTNIIPNVRCTKWFGFRGKIIDSPSFDMCRSQMDVRIDGDWRKLLRDMQGFHTVVCYGDYLREVGYALKKVRLEWENVSETT